ncbi:gliding motility-associated C-terminal domain-containing protein [Aquimarina sp. MMG016]|uniref:gliding motility-associated C-terminal domain-containing protein n=1 Tax=Aquimarina sp. MMG016 TaxID=2822690 RepID=UPI001B3A1E63|nr:gliding motility-associated C-terminal domain-containing protein [Aquimarina sp. MMG016]MBQ4819214.1 gliding motility-associated C-terminal domain-containing protein [Aquimarina sp. MMG016]
MKYKTKLLLLFSILFLVFHIANSQCDNAQTITICDMTSIDFDTDGNPDGIINLYDETGIIPQAGDEWFDPDFNFALESTSGILRLWDLDNASVLESDYRFILRNSNCPSGIITTVDLILGPYSGEALPPAGINEVNIEVCDVVTPCSTALPVDLDLFETLVSLDGVPPPHLNGSWEYIGPSNPSITLIASDFNTTIPYVPGGDRVDQADYLFRYTVNGIDPQCITPSVTEVKVSVVRPVFSGYASKYNICENRIKNGEFDADLNLRDDRFLLNEDLEGTWTIDGDQITSLDDSTINLKTLYDDIIASEPRFGCKEFEYTYSVEQRSGVCNDDSSTVKFTIFEELKPFRQKEPFFESCPEDITGTTRDLFDFLEFTEENGVLFDYIDGRELDDYVLWEFVSGPSDLALQANFDDITITPPTERHRGVINISSATVPGVYTFKYTVSPLQLCPDFGTQVLFDANFCEPSLNLNHPCEALSTEVVLVVFPIDYPGEDTVTSICETQSSVSLISLLDSNGGTISTTGIWTDQNGDTIDDTFDVPDSGNPQTFSFTYTTTTGNGCVRSADLDLTINTAPFAGDGTTASLCSDNLTVTLFNLLEGNPDTTGTWTGPFGYRSTDHLGVFDANDETLPILGAGNYVYTVPANAGCNVVDSATVTITIADPIEIGNDVNETFCKIDGRVNLFSLLDRDTVRTGVFEDTDGTGALTPEGVVEFETLTNGIYNFRYVVVNALPCNESSLVVAIQIVDLPEPIVPDQEFCILDAKRLDDIEVDVANYNWYEELNSDMPIIDNPLLIDGQIYYIANVDVDGCESERVAVTINILNTGEKFSNKDKFCTLDFQDGVSPDGNNQNDTFEMVRDVPNQQYNIPEAFPDFVIKIYNRYGSLVYEGNMNTEEFRGESNVSLTLGDDLPSGTYFYVFEPNFANNLPIQGSFYLSR